MESPEYEEEMVRGMLSVIETEVVEQEAEQNRLRNLALEAENERRLFEERELERRHQLEILRLQSSSESSDSDSQNVSSKIREKLVHLLPKFDLEKLDLAVYLELYERQAVAANIPEREYVTYLMSLIPAELIEVVLQEPLEKQSDFSYIKSCLLERFKLNAEAFRQRFFKTKKEEKETWKSYCFKLKTYLERWIEGWEIKTFKDLIDVMLTETLKRRIPPEIKLHFIDFLHERIESSKLVEKIENYETARSSFASKAEPEGKKSSRFQGEQKSAKKPPFQKSKNVEKTSEQQASDKRKISNPVFDRRREIKCWECGLSGHFRNYCPKLNSKQPEKVNRVNVLPEVDYLQKYVSEIIVNDQKILGLRDTGASIDLINESFVKPEDYTGETTWIKGALDSEVKCLPLAKICLISAGKMIDTKAAVVSLEGTPEYYLISNRTQDLLDRAPCNSINAITRSQAKVSGETQTGNNLGESLSSESHSERKGGCDVMNEEAGSADEEAVFLLPDNEKSERVLVSVSRKDFETAQRECPDLFVYRERAKANVNNCNLKLDNRKEVFLYKNELLFRLYKDHRDEVREQLVIPKIYRNKIMKMTHEGIAAHLGVTKTKDRILRYFYWPGCYQQIENWVKSCDACQRVGKPRDKIKYPLKLVPIISEIFSKINIDTCGPLPMSTQGNRYLVTALCMASKYPDAIPVKDISSVSVVKALMEIFSRMGYPREVQCDLGTSFVSNLTTEFFDKFGIKVCHSSVAHPQTNPVERWHRSVKRILKAMCVECGDDWEKHLPSALLALRTVPHESTGFTPSELIHGRNLRTPETLVFENWVEPDEENLPVTEYVFDLLNRMKRCQELAITKLEETRDKRKFWYDRGSVKRKFQKGDSVLIFATYKPNKMAPQWLGPCVIESQISETNYLVRMPGEKGRTAVYHVNMLKPYHRRPEMINLVCREMIGENEVDPDVNFSSMSFDPNQYDFEEIARTSELKKHLNSEQIEQLERLLSRYSSVFSNEPGRTDLVEHDIKLVDDRPVRSRPYRTSPRRTEILREEVKRMIELGVVEVGESDYASPMILVEVPGKDPRPCIDYRALNKVIRTEFYPLPNLEERVEQVSSSKFISLLDLTKGYWQVPLSPAAQRIAAFVTSFGSYRPLTMPFGLRNAPYFYSKLMAQVLRGCEKFAVPYLDDVAIFSSDWEEHLSHIQEVLDRISRAKLTIKMAKCRFAQNKVTYLGHDVGSGHRTPGQVKVQAILEFPQPKTKTQLRAFLGLAGYYAHYIENFSVVAAPLTDALKGKNRKGEIVWTEACNKAFGELKDKLISAPVLHAPDFSKEFLVQTDASDVGMGIVLSQVDETGQEHPIVYLSKKFTNAERRYSTSEKECASIIFAIKKLHHYLDGQEFTIVTDHNPLVFLQQNSGNNARLLRWALALQPYNYKIVHKSGKHHKNADGLSRVDTT